MNTPKNLKLYRFNKPSSAVRITEEAFSEFAFKPCGSQDISKLGFIPALCEGSTAFLHEGGGHRMVALQKEEKIIPGAYVKKILGERAVALEVGENRKLTKKERDALKEDVVQELLPRAMTRTKVTRVYFIGEIVAVDSSSLSGAEEALALIRKALGTLPVVPVSYKDPIESTMTAWIKDNDHPGLLVPQNGAYLVCQGEGGKANIKDEDLQSDEVLAHIEAGKEVHRLDLHFNDDAAFTLHADGSVKKLKLAEEYRAKNDDIGNDDKFARADADFILVADLVDRLACELKMAFGGYPQD